MLGNHVPLTGQVPRDPNRLVKSDGHKGVVFEQSPEEEAFLRWQSREFHTLEREFASTWRANLESLDLKRIPDEFRNLGISGRDCKSTRQYTFVRQIEELDKSIEYVPGRLPFNALTRKLVSFQANKVRTTIDGTNTKKHFPRI